MDRGSLAKGAMLPMTRPLTSPGVTAFARLWTAYADRRTRRERREAHSASLTNADLLAVRIEESRSDVAPIAAQFLKLAVPMWIDSMRWWRPAHREMVAHRVGEEIAASHALVADENPEGRVPRSEQGTVAVGFNLVAQGLALLAFCPGGVVFAGCHWEAQQGQLPAEAE